MQLHFFIVDDDPDYAELVRYQLRKSGKHRIDHYETGEKAIAALEEQPDLIFLDVVMPGQGGLETLRKIKESRPEIPVVMISAQSVVNVALEAIKLGAFDYVTKGHDDIVKLRTIAGNVGETIRLKRHVQSLQDQLPSPRTFQGMVGHSAEMARVFTLIKKTLRGDLTVAIMGESGTGKELVAQAIHYNSSRRHQPYVLVNCAAIPSELIESEFFGHEKGSFTGAHARKIGKFEQADTGTIFLDEIGELDLSLQAKLLRVLQNQELQRVGGADTIRIDVRVICATNRDIDKMLDEGLFREDLYYRLFQFPVELPPLRKRGNDVESLAEHFRKRFLEAHPDIENKKLSRSASIALESYSWPGNVRELKSTIERALLISDTPEIIVEDLMLPARHNKKRTTSTGPAPEAAGTSDTDNQLVHNLSAAIDPDSIISLEDVKKLAIEQAYKACNGNINKTAEKLGVTRSTVYRLMRKYGIED
ncbi:MAG: sigma-54-dependent Fis family transcriptional regulator [Rhodothermales bacterium]|nr:sigma-54-dependent Fis family transcriptional regulator [Rhodothermales bacterium]